MLSYASIPLPSKKVYVPIEATAFFDAHPKSDWDANKNDIFCAEHNVSFRETTNLKPIVVNTQGVYYSGISLPIAHMTTAMDNLELNRDYAPRSCCA